MGCSGCAQVVGKSLPRPPVEVGLLPHWLLVDGVQPAIPENAALDRSRPRKRARATTAGMVHARVSSNIFFCHSAFITFSLF